MKYKDQFTPWKQGENALEPCEALLYFAYIRPEHFVKTWLDMEICISYMMESSRHYAVAKSRYKK